MHTSQSLLPLQHADSVTRGTEVIRTQANTLLSIPQA